MKICSPVESDKSLDSNQSLKGHTRCSGWELGSTREISRELHIIPFTVYLDKGNPPVRP
jgi:hypothetical protein